ncbi:hypothetical protein BCR43DRAFT_488099, partial [Syncephalastrum racemosum]
MIALSQPSTPRPSPAVNAPEAQSASPNRSNPASAAAAAAAAAAFNTPSFQASPYIHPSSGGPIRKRTRSDSLFPPDIGPFFSSSKPFDNVFALDRVTPLTIKLQSKMDRGFFLADNDWTCYRRNYFQVSSAFSIHGISHYFPEHEAQCLVRCEDGNLYPARRFFIGMSARVSNSDKKIDLVQHTPKRDKGPQSTPDFKPVTPGGNLSMASVGTNQNIVTFERIQFKTATANNGKRRAAQQYYVCVMDLFAQTDHGEQVKIASCQSTPLVVRGRSPGHYADSHERSMSSSSASLASHEQSAPAHQPPHHSSVSQSAHHPHHHAVPPPPPPHYQPAADDGRFHSFPRPPYTPPAMMPGEYGSSYPYYSHYQAFGPPMHPMMMTNGPPTPSPPQHTPTSSPGANHGPYHHHPQQHQQQSHYMVQPALAAAVATDPSSSSSPASSPHMYHHNGATNDYHHPHQRSSSGMSIHMDQASAAAAAAADWADHHKRMQSSTSVSSNPANTAAGSPHQSPSQASHPQVQTPSSQATQPAQQTPQPQPQQATSYFAQGTPTLSSATSQTSAFSPTTPTTPYVNNGARKYNSVPSICNQQTL